MKTDAKGTYCTRLVQQMDSANLIGFGKERRGVIHNDYVKILDKIGLHGPSHREFNWLFGYLKKEAVFGCAFCKGFASYEIDLIVKSSWNQTLVEAETSKFGAWLSSHTGATSKHVVLPVNYC